MKYLKYILIISATLLLLIFLTKNIYFRQDIIRYSGAQPLSNLIDTVEVFTDKNGVPHIFAKNNEDLFFTSGYIIARERLFQLSFLASVMHGEISKLLGNEYLEHDKHIKQNDIFSINNENNSIIDDENIKLIEAYCLGINTWINETSGSPPISFKKMDGIPVRWETSEAVNILNLMTKNRATQRSKFYIQKMIKQYFGEMRYSELINAEDEQELVSDSLFVDNLKLENEILSLIGVSGSLIGNNAMVLPANKTYLQKPILIFNDDCGAQQFNKWYDIYLNGGDFNMEGVLIPGFPLPLVGKTDVDTWAISGELTTDKINLIFDFAKNSKDVIRTTKLVKSISYADTSGYYFDNATHSKRLNLLKEELLKKEAIQIDDIIKSFAETNNKRKSEMAHRIVNIYEENSSISDGPIEILVGWNGDESHQSAELILFNAIYSRLKEKIFKDEMQLIGNDIYIMFSDMADFSETSVMNILFNSKSSWLDDISTANYQETLEDIIIKSVDGALSELTYKYGNNTANWQSEKGNKQEASIVMHKIYDLSDMSTTEETIRNSNKYQKLILYPVE